MLHLPFFLSTAFSLFLMLELLFIMISLFQILILYQDYPYVIYSFFLSSPVTQKFPTPKTMVSAVHQFLLLHFHKMRIAIVAMKLQMAIEVKGAFSHLRSCSWYTPTWFPFDTIALFLPCYSSSFSILPSGALVE